MWLKTSCSTFYSKVEGYYKYKRPYKALPRMAQFDWSVLHNALAFQNMQRILQFRASPDRASNKYKSLKSG